MRGGASSREGVRKINSDSCLFSPRTNFEFVYDSASDSESDSDSELESSARLTPQESICTRKISQHSLPVMSPRQNKRTNSVTILVSSKMRRIPSHHNIQDSRDDAPTNSMKYDTPSRISASDLREHTEVITWMRNLLETPLGSDLASSSFQNKHFSTHLNLSEDLASVFNFEFTLESLYRDSVMRQQHLDQTGIKPPHFYLDSTHREYLSALTTTQYNVLQDVLCRTPQISQYVITLQMLLKLNSGLCYYDPQISDLDWIAKLQISKTGYRKRQLYPVSILPYLILVKRSVIRLDRFGDMLPGSATTSNTSWSEIYQDRGYFYPCSTHFVVIPKGSEYAAKMYPLAVCKANGENEDSYPGIIYEPVLISDPLLPKELMTLFKDGKYRRSSVLNHPATFSISETRTHLDFYLFSLIDFIGSDISRALG